MAKIVLNPVTNGNTLSVINANFDKIEAEFQDKVAYRDNPVGETNTVRNDLDLDGNDVFNVGTLATSTLLVDGVPVEGSDIAAIPQLRNDVNVLQNEMNTAQADIINNFNIEQADHSASLRTSGAPIAPIQDAASRANKYLVYDASGNPITSFGTGTDLGLRSDLAAITGPALIGFKQNGTGSITRTIDSKNKDIVSVLDFGGTWDGVANVSSVAQAALDSGAKVVDFLNLPGKVNTALTVPTGVVAKNINLIAGTAGMNVILVNTSSEVYGKITGTSSGGSVVERGIYPAASNVTDVKFDVSIVGTTVGLQINDAGLGGGSGKRWKGTARFTNITGGGVSSNGYGLLISAGESNEITVFSTNTPRHCVYISNGSIKNKITLFSAGCGGAPVQLFATAIQNPVENNTVVATVSGMTATASTDKYALNVLGKTRDNTVELTVTGCPLAEGAVQFRADDADTVPHRNSIILRHKDNFIGVGGLIRSNSGYENTISVFGSGASTGGGTTNLIVAAVYAGIIPNGQYDCALHVKELIWDAQGANMRGLTTSSTYAPVDIGNGVFRGYKNSIASSVFVSAGSLIGYTHMETFRTASTSIPAGTTQDFVITFTKPFQNAAFPVATIIQGGATITTMSSFVFSSITNAAATVKIKNGDATNPQNHAVLLTVTGY